MVNRKISKIFNLEVESDNEGSVLIPSSIFVKSNHSLDDIKHLLTEEAYNVGQPFYYSTVTTQSGIRVTWAKEFKDAFPVLELEEELLGDGLIYIIRKVG